MKTYGQFCPLAQATQLLCERWTLLIARELLAGSSRFSELQKGVPLMSPTLLSARLKSMLKAGIIKMDGQKGEHGYSLTPAGLELRPIVELLGAWGHRWSRSHLETGDLDAGLLMWDMRRTVDSAVFPKQKVVIEFEYNDAPEGARHWWLVCENNEIDLCLTDNGYDVDCLIKCSLKTMTAVWICEYSFNEAVKKGDIKVLGNPDIARKLQDWLRSSGLARLGSMNALPEINWN
ncbi:winged helix-turn-helix transcriptional regulator [Marinobacterium rhizophilum]|uniref:winged helix-turn-helix transcriptional regulator n=1 Tax=Marinobacterium rhizophilum TaxID=420402 RepID=UPI00037CCE98|nr:helix-turn-helix domain-containing protein [Marinobacterium rhizophilum]